MFVINKNLNIKYEIIFYRSRVNYFICCNLKGEEVYNTYGCNANGSLLQMYGFAEDYPQNLYDTVVSTNIITTCFTFCLINGRIIFNVNFGIALEILTIYFKLKASHIRQQSGNVL